MLERRVPIVFSTNLYSYWWRRGGGQVGGEGTMCSLPSSTLTDERRARRNEVCVCVCVCVRVRVCV